MIVNRLGEFRARAGLSYQALAEKIGSTVSTLRRLEEGETALVHELVEPLARLYGVAWTELLLPADAARPRPAPAPSSTGLAGPATFAGLAESGQPFVPPAGHPLAGAPLGDTEAYWRVKGNGLDAIGLVDGDVVVLDIGAAAVANVATGDVVAAQVYGPGITDAVSVMRQFIAPDLLIVNSRRDDSPPIHIDRADVAIKGVARRKWGDLPRR